MIQGEKPGEHRLIPAPPGLKNFAFLSHAALR